MEYLIRTTICILLMQTCDHAPGPNNLDVTLSSDQQPNILHLGYKRATTVKLKFPVGTTSNIALVVKPFTTKLVMALGLATVTKRGFNIQPFSSILYYSVLSSTMSTGFYVILSGNLTLGDITNSGSSSVEDDNIITILTEVYVQSVEFVTNEEQHTVVFEVFSGKRALWSDNVIYFIKTAVMAPIKTPEIYTSFPSTSTLDRGKMTRVVVDLWMPLANPDIIVTARSQADSGVRVLRVSVTEVGENYRLPVVLNRYIVDDLKCDEIVGNTTLHLVFPTHFANKNAFFAGPVSSNDSIKLEVAAYIEKDVELGTVHPLEIRIDVAGSVLWNSTFDLISSDFVIPPILTQLKALSYNSLVTIGQDFSADVNLTTPEFGVYEINVTLTSLRSGGQGEAGLAMVSDMLIVITGSNVLCSTLSVSYSRTSKSRIQNVAEVVLNVTNFGSALPSPGEDKNWLVLRFSVIPVPKYAEIGDVHSVEINSSSLSVTYPFTVNGATTFDQNLVYTVETFHFESAACIFESGTFEIFVNITTTRNKSPGPMSITFPFGKTVFSIKKYNIIHVGENLLPCFQTIQLDGSLDQFTVYDDGSFGNVTLEFPLVCNKAITSNTEADMLTIRVVTSLRPDVQLAGVTTDDFTVVVSSPGLTQDILSSLHLTVQRTTRFPNLAVISGVAVTQTDLDVTQFAMNCLVEYGGNSTGYQNATLIYESENTTHVVYGFENRLLGTDFRIVETTPGNVSCCVVHQFLTQNLGESLKVFGDTNGSLLSKMTSVFDNKNTTCIQLPVPGQTVPILWIRLHLSKLWSLAASSFRLTISGHGITCEKHNKDSVLQVFYASSPTSGDFHGDVTYCLVVHESMNPSSLLSQCSYQCPCTGSLCSEAFVLMTSSNNANNRTLCEITAENV